MKLTDQEQVILKAIEHVAGSRNGLASVPAVTRAVNYPISTTQKILAALHRKEIIALHHHDYPAQMTADEKKRAVKIGNDYFHAVAIRNPMKRGAAKKNPSPAQLKARAAFTRMAKARAKAAKKSNPRKRRASNPRYLVSATDARGNIADLGVLVSPNKTQAVARAKKLYKGYKKFTAAIVDKGDYIGPKGVIKIRRKRPTKKANPYFIVSLTDTTKALDHPFRDRHVTGLYAMSKADAFKEVRRTHYPGRMKPGFKLTAREIKDDIRNPRAANGIAKTAGKAIKKVTRVVLGGVSKVAGKGARALKNPALSEAALALIARLQIEKSIKVYTAGAPEYKLYEQYARIFEAQRKSQRGQGYYSIKLRSGWKTAVKKAQENPSRRRNLDHRDSSHQVKVHQHWRAGGLSQWQRAHHAGQHDLFSHGIKAKAKRNPDRRHLQAEAIEYALKGRTLTDMKSDFEYANFSPKEYAIARKYFLQFRGKSPEQIQALMSGAASKARAGFDAKKKRRRKTVKKNPSATAIRKKFAGRVSGSRDLYFPKGAPQGLAKLGRLVSIKLKGGKLIKPSRRNPSAEIWLCSDTSGKLWLGCTKAGPLYAGAPGDLGEMSMLEYAESKPHLGYANNTIWFHKMGEVSGRRPHLIVNDDQDLLIKGGNYKITRAGIVD